MKKALLVLLSVITVWGSAACQKTPESPIVVGKNENTLIEKAKEGTALGELSTRLNASVSFQHDFISPDNQIAVVIDANVIVPKANVAPILRVGPGQVTQEQADVLLADLTHTTLYDPYAAPAKNEIMQRILACKAQLALGPSQEDLEMTHYDKKGNVVTWEKWMEQSLTALYNEYNSAPDKMDCLPISGKFTAEEGGLELIYGEGISDEHGYEGIQIYNGEGMGNSRALYSQNNAPDGFYMDYTLLSAAELPAQPDVSLSDVNAKQLCDALTEKLNIPYMSHYSTHMKHMAESEHNPARFCWVLQYTRCINGFPATYTPLRGDAMTEDAYIAPWPYETLTYYVNDAGIVGMCWEAPYEILETVVEDSAMMDFAEIMDVFEKLYPIANAGLIKEANISEIRLGYMRIAAQNDTKSALLIPVWDFFGTRTHEDNSFVNNPELSLFTINAIDGSIMDRGLGH